MVFCYKLAYKSNCLFKSFFISIVYTCLLKVSFIERKIEKEEKIKYDKNKSDSRFKNE